jgi:hypothetical protein
MSTPPTPDSKAKVQASRVLIRPEATGLLAVRFISASVSFSTIWLIVFLYFRRQQIADQGGKNHHEAKVELDQQLIIPQFAGKF